MEKTNLSILDRIIAHKRVEVEQSKRDRSPAILEKSPFFARKPFSLFTSLSDPGGTGIIAEFKRRSPSKGVINDTVGVEEVTTAYAREGAAGLSVLTDAHFFGGHHSDLEKARINPLPILRKDFIIDSYQILEAKAMGADVILLIAACLEPAETRRLALFARSLGLDVLLEVHHEDELDHICPETTIVGVNNRDLKTFVVDINRSLELAMKIPREKILISESGLGRVDAILTLKEAGFRGFLIGEHFMKEKDPGIAFGKFVRELRGEASKDL